MKHTGRAATRYWTRKLDLQAWRQQRKKGGVCIELHAGRGSKC